MSYHYSVWRLFFTWWQPPPVGPLLPLPTDSSTPCGSPDRVEIDKMDNSPQSLSPKMNSLVHWKNIWKQKQPFTPQPTIIILDLKHCKEFTLNTLVLLLNSNKLTCFSLWISNLMPFWCDSIFTVLSSAIAYIIILCVLFWSSGTFSSRLTPCHCNKST